MDKIKVGVVPLSTTFVQDIFFQLRKSREDIRSRNQSPPSPSPHG